TPGERRTVDVALSPAMTISGIVLDVKDAPVAGAVGYAGVPDDPSTPRSAPVLFRTGADGAFAIPRRPLGSDVSFTVVHPDFQAQAVASGLGSGMSLRLRRG